MAASFWLALTTASGGLQMVGQHGVRLANCTTRGNAFRDIDFDPTNSQLAITSGIAAAFFSLPMEGKIGLSRISKHHRSR
jgi:hypothetical protein